MLTLPIQNIKGDRIAEIPSSSVKVHKKERYARSNDLLHALKKHLEAVHKLSFSITNLYVIRYLVFSLPDHFSTVSFSDGGKSGMLPHTMHLLNLRISWYAHN